MPRLIDNLSEIAGFFDAIVLDQWGVLHDGSAPYPGAVKSLVDLSHQGHRLAVLSNSGKRSSINRQRIANMGFPDEMWCEVITSGEALWRDIRNNHIPERRFFPTERDKGDAEHWANGLDIQLVDQVARADAILLLGLPDDLPIAHWDPLLTEGLARNLPLYCANPDHYSVRKGSKQVPQPGYLAKAYEAKGGKVVYYGKPHPAVFSALETSLGTSPDRILMVGDSLHHDIAGACNAGWASLFICNGLHGNDFAEGATITHLENLARHNGVPLPGYVLKELQ